MLCYVDTSSYIIAFVLSSNKSTTNKDMADWKRELALVALGAASGLFIASLSRSNENAQIVKRFLKAQSDRDLDKMCELVSEDIIYINEPHPPERTIKGKRMFREAFSASPCIWCPEADLQTKQMSVCGNTVFVERLDRFHVDGVWLEIPICGYLKVKNGVIYYWKDYWDYSKYKEFVVRHFGPEFSLFRLTRNLT